MKDSLGSRVRKAWDVFMNRSPTYPYGHVSYSRPDRTKITPGKERTIVAAILNRIAIDVASIDVKHVRLDDNGRYISEIDSNLNECLTVSANLDQTSRAFLQDVTMSLLDEGCVAIVPTETSENIYTSNTFDVFSMRTGKIVEWHSKTVKVQVYNEAKGKKEEIVLPKQNICIIENPLYSVINERNSTLQRLIRKLNLLDVVDEQSGSGKLDLIIQLPYAIRTESRRSQAENRRNDIEAQLSGSKFGIAYTDATEKITQLNRPIENNLMGQIEYLTNLLYSQLGITKEVMDGTASETVMLNYYNRTIEPIVGSIVDEINRKFLTKTARTQRQAICSFRDPFGLVPVQNLADIADKFTRNEIMTSNEIRQVIGMKPSDDPKADQLINSNINPGNLSDYQTGGYEADGNDDQYEDYPTQY